MAEFFVDDQNGVQVLNETDVDTGSVFRAFAGAEPEMAALVRWTHETKPPASRDGGLFARDRFVTPDGIYDQIRVARDAAETDDVVSGVIESTEAMAFSKMSIDCIGNEEETDIWNQIAADLDLDSRLREMWREDFTISQVTVAMWWGVRDYRLSGRTEAGTRRKKVYSNLRVPIGLTVLDPLKIVPVGNSMFNQDKLAYVADRGEVDVISRTLSGETSTDRIISQLIAGPYEPSESERRELGDAGCPSENLYLLNPRNVWRHTSVRPAYKKFPPVRMKSVLELLDLKHQLRAVDRAVLIGGSNFIVLVKKGSDTIPAKAAEVQNLQAQVRVLARVPVIVGDHRLSIEIITPKNDHTLEPDRYNGIDARITSRLFQLLMSGNFAAGMKGDDSIKVAKFISKGIENRRHMLRRSLERHVLRPTYERNAEMLVPPKLRFHPKRVALDFDPTIASFLQDLRDRGDLSRESILEELDFDQSQEAVRRQIEHDKYDEIFQTITPWGKNAGPDEDSSPEPTPEDPKTSGRNKGGNRQGGGAAPGSGQGQAPRNPAKTSD
jgi:hypothetical protein